MKIEHIVQVLIVLIQFQGNEGLEPEQNIVCEIYSFIDGIGSIEFNISADDYRTCCPGAYLNGKVMLLDVTL